jgi:hypothetical protein
MEMGIGEDRSVWFSSVLPISRRNVTDHEIEREMHKERSEFEDEFCRLMGFGRIFSRSEKHDVKFPAFLGRAIIAEALRIL